MAGEVSGLATWLALHDEHPNAQLPAHVERELRAYLECGILAFGFADAESAAKR